MSKAKKPKGRQPDEGRKVIKPTTRLLTEEVSVSVETAGLALGLKRSSAYAAIRNNELPFVKVGRRIAVPTSWLRRQLQIEDRT
jgi:excisionase family DNA binding protein